MDRMNASQLADLARRTGPPGPRWLHRAARRRAPGRVCPAGRRAAALADRLLRQRRPRGRAARPRGGVHRRPLRAAARGADRPGAVGAAAHHRGTAARPGSPARAARRPHRLRPAADRRGRPAALHRCRPDDGAGGHATRSTRSGPTVRRRRWTPAVPQPLDFAGRTSEEKREEIAAALRKAKQDAAVVTDPASIAWLLNIRGSDVPFTPFALGFAIVHADAGCELFMAPQKLPPATREWLGNAVSVPGPRRRCPARWRGWPASGCGSMPAGSPVWFAQRLRAAGADCGRRAPIPACCQRRARTPSSSRAPRRPRARRRRRLPLPALAGTRRRARDRNVGGRKAARNSARR